MTQERTAYIRSLFGSEDALLKKITSADDPIHIRAEDARILEFLIKSCGIKTVVEVGTLAGYSAIRMARALPTDGHVYTLEQDISRAQKATGYIKESGLSQKITVITGSAQESMKTLSGPYDMIFIDADKISYIAYLNWAEKNIRKGGLIVGDNTFLFGAVYQDALPEGVSKTALDAMLEFNQRLSDPARYTSMMIPSDEGLTVGMKLF